MAENVNLRALVLETLLEAEKTNTKLNDLTGAVLEKYSFLPKSQRAFYTFLTQGVTEKKIYLDFVIGCYSKVPLKKIKPVIKNILRMSIYQIKEMNSVPDSAAVNEAVKLAKKKGFASLTGFINAVLRSVIREPEKVKLPEKKDAEGYLSVKYSMPPFIVSLWLERFGLEKTEAVCSAFLEKRKTTVRIRLNKEERAKVTDELIRQGVTVEKAPYPEEAYFISHFDNIRDLKSFKNGSITVQDISSQLAVKCIGITKDRDLKILDICAAPGGKSLFAADLSSDGTKIIARDVSYYKTDLIDENAERCHTDKIKTEVFDAAVFDEGLEDSMDVVIADLPCSGLGVIGHKPDIKYNITAEGIAALAELQKKIIDNAVRYVKKGGVLLYSTCTISKEENEDNVEYILEKGDFEAEDMTPVLPESFKASDAAKGYLQIFPDESGCDGFFISKFRRKE